MSSQKGEQPSPRRALEFRQGCMRLCNQARTLRTAAETLHELTKAGAWTTSTTHEVSNTGASWKDLLDTQDQLRATLEIIERVLTERMPDFQGASASKQKKR